MTNNLSRRTGVAMIAALVSLTIAAPAVATTGRVTKTEPKILNVMTWNMCGSQRPTWGCVDTGTPREKIDVVRWHVANSYVRAVLLQEVCEVDLTLLLDDLGSAWSASFAPYQWSQAGVRIDSPCGPVVDGNRIGTAIVARAGLSGAQTYATTQPWTGQQRPFHCATATYWGVRLCNVHLTPAGGNPDQPTWEYADDQLVQIRDTVAGFPKVVFGGDFNVNPPDWPGNTRAWLWPSGIYDTYLECDQVGTLRTGRPTHDGGWKLDYVFSNLPRRWCALGDSAFSDHHVLIESVAV